MQEIAFPRHLDDPPTLLLWRLDDLTPVVAGLMVGILAGELLASLLAGAAAAHGYRRFRERQPDGYILHLLYWIGAVPIAARSVPNPFARRWLP